MNKEMDNNELILKIVEVLNNNNEEIKRVIGEIKVLKQDLEKVNSNINEIQKKINELDHRTFTLKRW